jgi:hypothetical protein
MADTSALVISGPGAVSAPTGASLAARLSTEGRNLSTDRLAPHLPRTRVGDPLGLGIGAGDRPPPPADPDVYDVARENAEFSRSLLSEAEQRKLDGEKWLTIEEVRNIVTSHSAKGTIDSEYGLDPEVIILVDQRVNYKIFLAGDNLYTRDELYRHFPFQEFGVQPEAIFAAQEVAIFPPRKYAMADDLDYQARDVGDETIDFIPLEDMVGMAARDNYTRQRAPLRVVRTKIYVGRDDWKNFELMARFARGMVRISAAQIAYGERSEYGGAPGASPFAALMGAPAGPARLTDAATAAADAARREEELARREAEAARREEESRRREEESRRREEEISARISADIARLEKMMARAGMGPAARAEPELSRAGMGSAARAEPGPTPAAPAAEPDDSDSVPL